MKKTAFLALLLLASIAHAGARLTGDALKAFYTDKTLTSVHHKKGPGKTYFSADGTVHSKRDRGEQRTGKWWIDDATDKRCLRWSNHNKDFCHYTQSNGDGTYVLIHGDNGKRLVEISETVDGNALSYVSL